MYELNQGVLEKDELGPKDTSMCHLGAQTSRRLVGNDRQAAEFTDTPELAKIIAAYLRRQRDEEPIPNEIHLQEYSVEHYRLLCIPVKSFQNESEWEWHYVRATGKKV